MVNALLSGLNLLLHPFRRLSDTERGEMPKAPAGHYDWDIAGNVVAWDEAYDRLLGGRPRDTSASQDWWIGRIHPDDRDRTVLGLCGALDGAASRWTARYRILGAGGECIEVREQADIVRDAVGEATRLTGQMRVVTRGARRNRYDTPAVLTST
jgi:PAS domain-containing protein